MSDKHLKLDVHPIDHEAWWYEEPQGVAIIVQIREGGPKSALIAGTEEIQDVRAEELRVRDFPWIQENAALRTQLAEAQKDAETYKHIAKRNHKANMMPCPRCHYQQLEIKPLAANRGEK